MKGAPAIHLEGYREFQRDLKAAVGGKLPKALGEAHKEVGRFIIKNLEPRSTPEAVGAGKGAAVRPSATKREVVLLAGGSHRTHGYKQQWGKTQVKPFQQVRGGRPYIKKSAERHEDEIRKVIDRELDKALKPLLS